MKKDKIAELLEAQGFKTAAEAGTLGGLRVTRGSVVALFDVTEDQHFRFGWVQHLDGGGRTDCLSWPEFIIELHNVAATADPAFAKAVQS